MKLLKYFPIFFLLVYCLVVFSPVISNKLPIPSDTIVGLYHPWRDELANIYPNGAPFKNFLITDPVRQQYPWRNLAIGSLRKGELPLWNPYSFSGTPLLGNLQSAAFYPFNILLVVFGFPTGWSIMIVLQVLLGGTFMWQLLRHWKLHPLAQTLGVLSWVGSGFWVSWLEWNTLVQTVLWLPLLLLLVDKIFFSQKKTLWLGLFSISLATSFFAGHLQTFFYLALVVAGYIAVRIWQTKKYKYLFVFLLSSLLFLILTFVQWWPFIKFLTLSAKEVDPNVLTRPDWFIPWQNLAQFIAPDFFGNPATLNYFGVWNYQEFVGYIGIAGLLFAAFSIFRRDKKTLFFCLLLFLSLIFALPTFLAQIPFVLKLPLISSAQPSRLMVLIDFSLAILAALGLDYFLAGKLSFKKILTPVVIISFSTGFLWLAAYRFGLTVSLKNLILPTVLIAASIFLLISSQLLKKWRRTLVVLLLLLSLFDLSRFFSKFESFSPKEWLFPNTKITTFLQGQSKNGVFRVAALDDKILPPNFSTMYKIQTVSGYDPLFLRRYGEFIASIESDKSRVNSPLSFNRIITPKNYLNPAFSLLNVKYYLSLSDIDRKNWELVFREGKTRVYEDKNVLPRAYFVEEVQVFRSPVKSMDYLLQQYTFQKTAIVEGNKIEEMFQFSPSTGEAMISTYSENKVVIKTKNKGKGFLALLDSYYPEWKATVDGQPTKIYLTDYTFRGVIVPAGNHTVRFSL